MALGGLMSDLSFTETTLEGLLLADLKAFADKRGLFKEIFRESGPFVQNHGLGFVQDNFSLSKRGVLRGLHGQSPEPQGKLVTCLAGAVWDVAVDARPDSPTFGQWEGFILSGENHRQLYIPEGFLHGFVALEEPSMLLYKVTRPFSAPADFCVRWDDPDLAVQWPLEGLDLIISEKDEKGMSFAELKAKLGA
jgi:dTDP-4-dehydrorhamnose 3,5-epimerase